MRCTVYRCSNKLYTYLYIPAGSSFDDLPVELVANLGELEQVMELDLAKLKRLAYADIDNVRSKLVSPGYYLQLPPEQSVDDLLNQAFSYQV